MSTVPVFVGIDISKDRLDLALRPTGEREAVPNTESDIAALVARLQACHPTLIVLEATGGFELAVTAALAAARQPVVVVNPRQGHGAARQDGCPRCHDPRAVRRGRAPGHPGAPRCDHAVPRRVADPPAPARGDAYG